METFSALLAICVGNSPVPDEFPTQRPETRSFDVFFDLRLNKQSGRSPKVVALFSATNFSSYTVELLQLHDTIQIKWNFE